MGALLEPFLNQKKKIPKKKNYNNYICFESFTVRPRLGGWNEIEWKRMKRIILEYSSFPCLRV